MNRTVVFLVSLVAWLTCTDTVHAQQRASWTISPFHLVLPVVEITGEFAIEKRQDMSMGGILGYGSYDGASIFEIGLQYNYYALGNFQHGMQIGAELLYVNGSPSSSSPGYVNANGASLGTYLGYKAAADFGLTFNAQGGIALLVYSRAQAGYYYGVSGYRTAVELGPLVNLNIGWSF